MLKFVAGKNLGNLRYAKDEAGCLKRVRTPRGGAESYMTVKWDQLVPFPTSMFVFLSFSSSLLCFPLPSLYSLAWIFVN